MACPSIAAGNSEDVCCVLHELFRQTAQRVPNLPAVQWENKSLSYLELDRCSDAVAGWISRQKDCGNIVALLQDRGLEMVVAIIGALKAGKAYMPLLTSWPMSQQRSIMDEAECRYLVFQRAFLEISLTFSGARLELEDCRAFAQTEPPLQERVLVKPTDLAYIIYTSGSTGRPKGVMMHHGGTAANIARNAHLSCGEGTRCAFSNSYTFDVHVADIFKPLSQGSTVVVTRDIFRIPPVDVVSTLPNKLSRANVPRTLKTIIFTGEGMTTECIKPVPSTTQVLNVFGATEFFDATLKVVDPAALPAKLASIGRPLGSYVLLWIMVPGSRELAATGEAGELVVGGVQVCKGYIKRPELMDYKFFRAPWLANFECGQDRVYRTGDLARLCEDGEYEHLGRVEQHVQLHGHRADLAAIESQLTSIDGITEAAVVLRTSELDASQQLAVYVSPSSGKALVDSLDASFFSERMSPGVVVGLDDWPRTSSGKIDRNRLPEPGCAEASAPGAGGGAKPTRRRWIFHDPEPSGAAPGASAGAAREEHASATAFAACRRLAELTTLAATKCVDSLANFAQVEAYRSGCVFFNTPLPAPAEVAPVALLPSAVPGDSVTEVQALAPIFSRLLDLVACDVPWLMARLEPLRSVDPWMTRLLDMAEAVYGPSGAGKDPQSAPRLLLSRQDYLPHSDGRYLQVEINTIAVAFAGFTDLVARIHAGALRQSRCPEVAAAEHGAPLPDNTPGAGFARAIAAAHAEYLAIAPPADGTASVCFYCFHDDHLELDQRHIERALEEQGVPCIRAFLGARVELRGGVDGALIVDGTEISVVYFHCTYCPEHFASETDWENRKLIELSRAVKAPSLLAHLAGAKRVQQVLSDRAVLSRFLPQEEVAQCLAVFARQVDPSCAGNAHAVSEALAKPHCWVLKPQREGGGNNLYGDELAAALRAGDGLECYVLMEKICSTPAPAWLLQKGVAQKADTVAELGIFASYLARGNRLGRDSERLCDSRQVLVNSASGAVLRTKHASSDEGGVCAGFGVLDTPFLLASSSTLVTGCKESSKEGDVERCAMGPPYRWLPVECSCQFLENLYVRSVDAYFRMPAPGASEAEFWASNSNREQYDEETRAAIVASVHTEVGRRSAIPKLFCRNLAIVCKRYRPLHSHLFLPPLWADFQPHPEAVLGMGSSHIFQPEFLNIWQSVMDGDSLPEHVKDVRDGAFVFPLFSREFCNNLLEELKHFKSTGLPHQQPNSMNRQGCILNEIGLGPFMDRLLTHYLNPVFRVMFPELLAAGMNSHHSFVVRYKIGQDTSLGVHDDNSEITLNVALCDPDQYSGGKLALYHRERSEHPQLLKLDPPYIHCVGIGTALAHSGDLLHEVLPLSGGERAGLIMWLRSDAHRRSHGCPLCRKTDHLLFA